MATTQGKLIIVAKRFTVGVNADGSLRTVIGEGLEPSKNFKIRSSKPVGRLHWQTPYQAPKIEEPIKLMHHFPDATYAPTRWARLFLGNKNFRYREQAIFSTWEMVKLWELAIDICRKEARELKQRAWLKKKRAEKKLRYKLNCQKRQELAKKVQQDMLDVLTLLDYQHLYCPAEMKRGAVMATSKKQIKTKSAIYEPGYDQVIEEQFINCNVTPQFPIQRGYKVQKETPSLRFFRVIDQLKNRAGLILKQALCISYAQRLMKRTGFIPEEGIEQALEAEPQMEKEAQGQPIPEIIDHKGNVALHSQTDVEIGKSTFDTTRGFLSMCSASEPQTFEQISSRWLRYSKTVEWSNVHSRGKDILTLDLPYDILAENLTSPNVLPFLIHKYGRFDMRIKIMINSNKFQTGMLQGSFFYNAHLNQYFNRYDNVYSASQRNHVLISAGSSNSAELVVPYWALFSLMNLKNDIFDKSQGNYGLKMGRFSLKVLNQLRVSGNVPNFASISVFVSFENTEFRGLMDQKLSSPFPQMEMAPFVLNTTEKILNLSRSVGITDNPILPMAPPQFQPMTAHSFGLVQGQNEVLRSLRSDPRGQTQGVRMRDETTISDLLAKWSLLETVSWSRKDAEGSLIRSLELTPANVSLWHPEGPASMGPAPILSVISHLFAYWSGDLEFRFDFISNQFYSGRLIVCTVPTTDENVPLNVAKNSASEVFDLQESQQFVYRAPYYANRPLYPVDSRPGVEDIAMYPCRVFVYVLNRLMSPDTVPENIDINIYIRAADNFSLSCLRTPTLGLTFNAKVIKSSDDTCTVSSDYPQMFTSGSRWLIGSDGLERLSFFDSETTDYFTFFDNMKSTVVYQVPQGKIKVIGSEQEVYFRVQYYDSRNQLQNVKFFVRAREFHNYPVALIFNNLQDAMKYVQNKPRAIDLALREYKQGPWAEISKNGRDWLNISRSFLPLIPFEAISRYQDDFEHITMQMEQQRSDQTKGGVKLDPPASFVNYGFRLFGENVTSLKQVGMRWQHYGTVESGSVVDAPFSKAVPRAIIQVHPLRELIIDHFFDRDNCLRDGAISIITSGFAGYRGSIRFRIFMTTHVEKQLHFMVIHKFDEPYLPGRPPVYREYGVRNTGLSYADTGYAAELQSTLVNGCLEFEVPFYNTGEYNNTYIPPNDQIMIKNLFQSLGQVWVYCVGSDTIEFSMDVFYSLGDDFAFSNFQGFPEMLDINGIVPQMEVRPQMEYINKILKVPSRVVNMLSSGISMPEKVNTALDSMSDNISSATTVIKDSLTQLIDKLKNSSPFDASLALFDGLSGFGYLAFIQILHIMTSPTPVTISLAILSVLGFFLMGSSSILWSAKSLIVDFFSYLVGSSQARQQNPPELSYSVKIVSLLWSIITGMTSTVIAQPSNIKQFVSGLFKKSGDIFRTHCFGLTFFRDFLELFKRLWQYLNRQIGNKYPLYTMIKDDKELAQWITGANVLVDPVNIDRVIKSTAWTSKVFEYQLKGRLYLIAAQRTQEILSYQQLQIIKDLQGKLDKLVETLIKAKAYAPFRIRPFVLWVHGPGGIGKSYLCQQLISKIAQYVGISPEYYSHASGQRYYDLLTTQEFIYFDDFLALQTQEAGEGFAQYLQMVGTHALNLPRAAVEDKKTLDNFKFIVISTNYSDFSGVTQIHDRDAYNRRRDFIIEMNFKDSNFNPSLAKEDDFVGYKHVQFSVSLDGIKYSDKAKVNSFDEVWVSLQSCIDNHMRRAKNEFISQIEQFNLAVEQSAIDTLDFNQFCEKLEANLSKVSLVKDDISVVQERVSALQSVKNWFASKFSSKEEINIDAEADKLVKDLKETQSKSKEKPIVKPFYENSDGSVIVKHPDGDVKMSVEKFEEAQALANRIQSLQHESGKLSDDQQLVVTAIIETMVKQSHEESEKKEVEVVPQMMKAAVTVDEFDKIGVLSTTLQVDCANKYINDDIGLMIMKFAFSDDLDSPINFIGKIKVPKNKSKCIHYQFDFKQCVYYKLSDEGMVAYKRSLTYLDEETRLVLIERMKSGFFVSTNYLLPVDSCFADCCPFSTCAMFSNRDFLISQYWDYSIVQNPKLKMLILEKEKIRRYLSDICIEKLEPMLNKCYYNHDAITKLHISDGGGMQIVSQIVGTLPEVYDIDGVRHPLPWSVDDLRKTGIKNDTLFQRFSNMLGFKKIAVSSDGKVRDYIAVPAWYRVLNIIAKFIAVLTMVTLIVVVISKLISALSMLFPMVEKQAPMDSKTERAWKAFASAVKADTIPEMASSSHVAPGKQPNNVVTKSMQLICPKSQGPLASELLDFLMEPICTSSGKLNKVCRNSFFIVAVNKEDKSVYKMRCLGIFNHTAIGLQHYFDFLDSTVDKWDMFIFSLSNKLMISVTLQEIGRDCVKDSNLVLLTLPKRFGLFGDIRHFIPKAGGNYIPSELELIECTPKDVLINKVVSRFKEDPIRVKDTKLEGCVIPGWIMTDRLEYNYAGDGVCGSFIWNEKSAHPLLGIHTSGKGVMCGFSELITRDVFESEDSSGIEFIKPQMNLKDTNFMPDGPQIIGGNIDKDMTPRLPDSTGIVPSDAYGLFPTYTEPAPLTPKDPRLPEGCSPLKVGVDKRCDPIISFNSVDLEVAAEDLERVLINNCKPVRSVVSKLSYLEAINGLPGIPRAQRLEMSTSEGYPWVKMRPTQGGAKRWLFEFDGEDVVKIHPRLYQVLEYKDKMRAQGMVPATYYTAMLKDARISKEKVSIPGKTRVFEMSPVDLTIAQRQYTLDFNCSYMEKKFECENTIGINVNGPEWNMLAYKLLGHSPVLLSGDYSSYGPKLSLDVLYIVWDIIRKWYQHYSNMSKEELFKMKVLGYEVLSSYLVVGNYFFRPVCGMASGNASTVILNSLCNSLYIRVAYLSIARSSLNKSLASMRYFNKYVVMFSNGDDLIISVKDIYQWFNNKSLSLFFKDHNLKFTNPKKDIEIVEWEGIDDVSYLKCQFKLHPFRKNCWLAQLDEKSIYDCPQWIWKKDYDRREASIANAEQAVRLSYGHGEVFLNLIREKLKNYYMMKGNYIVFPTWKELDENVWDSNIDIWEFGKF
uniref:Genome polyprotein n=1 Tax=Cryptotermes domesticus iflavirus TaxID=3032213 RepID=A0AAT9J9W5_9VIRU